MPAPFGFRIPPKLSGNTLYSIVIHTDFFKDEDKECQAVFSGLYMYELAFPTGRNC